MDSDPWGWNGHEVQQFFLQDAIGFIADRPSGQLPPLTAFVQSLSDNDVDGAALLDLIDVAALKEDFGITSFRHRGTIMHCITKLRAASQSYRLQDASAAPQTPRSMVRTPLLPPTLANPASVLPSTEAVGGNVREGEVPIQDERGRKRRKLDLTTKEVALQPSKAGRVKEDAHSYLADTALPIDEIFYGPTGWGQVIGELHPDGSVLVDHHDPDTADDNFQFTSQHKRDGEAHFVHSRMQYFLKNAEQRSVRRRGRDAVAILPYRDGQQREARSAIVIQADKDDEYVAVKEQASLLQSGYDYSGQNQESTGEWDWLLQKHRQQESEEEISIGGDSENGRDSETVATTDDDDGKGPLAEVEDEEGRLPRSRIAELIDTEIDRCIVKWQDKLPALEEKNAWSVWKEKKKSGKERDKLMNNAKAWIAHLTRRLAELREDYLDREWSNEQDVQRACGSLESTIEDRELRKWKISVWLRRKEPAHTVIHRAKQSVATLQTSANGNAIPGFVPHPDDRLSFSPGLVRHVYPDIEAGAPSDHDNDNDEFHSANVSPVGSPAPDLDGFIAPSESSSDEDLEEHSHSSDLSEDDGFVNEIASSPPKGEQWTSPADEEMTGLHGDSMDARETVAERPECPVCEEQVTPVKGSIVHHVEDCLSKRAIESNDFDNQWDDDLPPASTFVPQNKRAPESSVGPRRTGQDTQPIDLTMLSDSPNTASSPGTASSPVPRKAKGKAALKKFKGFSGNPEQATGAEVDSWNWADLTGHSDRNRIIIKILREMGPQRREAVHQCLLKLTQKERVTQLQAAAKAHETGNPEDAGLDAEHSDHMMHCARIAAAWWLSNHKYYFDTDIADAPWKALHNDQGQVDLFLNQLLSLLKMKGSQLFSKAKAKRSHAAKKNVDSITIPDSSDEQGRQRTPHKRRKNKVLESQSANKTRTAAFARMAQYTQQMGSQTTDPSKLAAMIPSDGSGSTSEIEINPVRAADAGPHFIHPEIAKKMKPHQIEGVRFMWREITAAGDDGTQGCLLAHTMGLGKTMQTITLLVAVVEASETDDMSVKQQLPVHLRPRGIPAKRQLRIMVLCPPSLLQNWERELDQWAPRNICNVFTVYASSKADQMEQIESWHRVGGVLLIGYQMFRGFVIRKEPSSDRAAELGKILLEGPEIVVADEAHNIKSPNAAISQAANAFKTHTRIALTGTPMSNDLQEIYALVSWVAPGYLGEPHEFRANFTEPIQEGSYEDSTRTEQRRMKKKLAVLHNWTEPKVSRADITVLRGSLKPKVEFVITVPLTEQQQMLYNRYVVALTGGGRNQKASQMAMFSWLAVLGLLTTHPSAFQAKLLTKPAPKKVKKVSSREVTPPDDGFNAAAAMEIETMADQFAEGDAESVEALADEDVYSLGFTEAMVKEILRGVEKNIDPALSAKTSIFMDIVRISQACGDKLLVFSHRLPTLDYLSELFSTHNIRFGRIDGTVAINKRMQILEDFNRSKFEVMLISTRAGGVGLNIQGANRVVIMDFSFNPAHEEQAIGRAYRLGQTKPVFVYRFLAGGTFETKMWNTQLFKTSLTNRVVDKKNTKRTALRNTREYLFEPRPVEQDDLSKWTGKDPQVLDIMLARQDIAEAGKADMIRSISTTETLQEIVEDDPLNEEERKEVDEEINLGRTRGRMAIPPHAYLAANTSMGPVHAPASTQALRWQPYAPRPSASQATAARFPPSTAPTTAGQPYLGGLPIHRPSLQGYQPSHGHPVP